MNARLQQLKTRWQTYSPRERLLIGCGAAALGVSMLYYAMYLPLQQMNINSQQTLKRQQETLNWMRSEIDNKNIPLRVITTGNVRSIVESSAKELNVSLVDIQQQGKRLSFTIAKINVYQLKNWMREINIASGVQLEKIMLTPVDHLSDVKAVVQLSWNSSNE